MNTVFLRKYYLVLFVVVLITGQTKGNSITVGDGFGTLIIDDGFSTYGLSTNDTIFIKPGIYDYMIVKNHNRRIYVMGNEGVIVDYKGSNLYSLLYNNVNLHFENITFRNGNYRGIHVSGECDGLVIKNIRFRDIPDVQLFFNELPEYDGTEATRRDSITIDGIQVDKCSYIAIHLTRGYNSVIKNCVIDSTIGKQGMPIELTLCKNIEVFDNTFTNINIGGTVHNGVIVMSGEGRIYNNRCINYQGDFIRGRAYSIDRDNAQDIGDFLVYNNFVWNSTKYGFMELQMFGDTSAAGVYGSGTVHSGRFKAYNNTAGRMRDLDYEHGGSMFSFYNFSRNDHEVKNNVVFFPRTDAAPDKVFSPLTSIFNNISGTINQVDTARNFYYTSWSQLADSLYGNLLSTSELIDKGIEINEFYTDYLGTVRPQGTAWDIGCMEYVPVTGTKNPYKSNSVITRISPNPFEDMLEVTVYSEKNCTEAYMEIFNIQGQKSVQQKLSVLTGENYFHVDMSDKPDGMYLVRIVMDKEASAISKCIKI